MQNVRRKLVRLSSISAIWTEEWNAQKVIKKKGKKKEIVINSQLVKKLGTATSIWCSVASKAATSRIQMLQKQILPVSEWQDETS